MIEWIDIEIYRCSVVFLIETTPEEWDKFYNEHKNEITERDNVNVKDAFKEEKTIGYCQPTEGNDYICYISDKDNKGLVAHEIFHVAQMLLWDKGYRPDDTAEPVAYLIEYLINGFYKLLEKAEK